MRMGYQHELGEGRAAIGRWLICCLHLRAGVDGRVGAFAGAAITGIGMLMSIATIFLTRQHQL